MAELGHGEVTQDVNTIPVPNVNSAEHAEKTLTQSEVNELVGRIKRETADKAKREALQEMQQNSMSSAPSANMGNSFPAQQQNMGGIPQNFSPEQVNQIMHQIDQQKTVAQFVQKMEQGKSKYPDFDEKVAKLNLQNYPHLVQWTNGLDNTADVIYDIASNPEKFSHVITLSVVSPHMAIDKLHSLSGTIKQNEAAKNAPVPPEPLDQIKPSTVGIGSGGIPSVKDYKRIYKG